MSRDGYEQCGATPVPSSAPVSEAFVASMRMYTFPFFADPALFDFVAAVAANGFPQPRLFVLAADAPTLRPEHLLARLPVYYGRPVLAMYDDAALKQLTGYSTAEALRVSGPVFAIGGRSPVFGRPGSFLTVLHGWGLNFESKATDDYRRFVRDGRLAEPEAGKEISRRVWLWASAAASLAGSGNGGGLSPRARLCLPAIGFGAFLSALPNPAAAEPFLRLAFTRALAFAASALGQTLSIELRDHSGVFSAESALLAAAGVAHSVGAPLGDLFRDPGGAVDAEGNVLVRSIASGEGENGLERLVLLNAWDDRSFIGNGGSRDPTVDGFFVAGSGPNKALRNASYLFNPAVSRGLLEPGSWAVVEEPPPLVL